MPHQCHQCARSFESAAVSGGHTTCPNCGVVVAINPADAATVALAPRPDLEVTQELSPNGKPHGQGKHASAAARKFGDYVIEQELARGGMGVVYRARQVSLNRPVALKMILSSQLASAEEIRRFHAEAEAAARLDHPGIVPVYEVGEIAGRHYFSMALVEGGSLVRLVERGPLECRAAAEMVRAIAESVAYAHARNIVHRDLKPANVLLDERGRPKVSDFGLAKRIDDDSNLTATGQVMGTPSYMAPEQAAGLAHEVGPPADVYALGGILYFLLTARPPFQGKTAHETIQQVLHREVESPRRRNPTVDFDLETICRKCLEKDARNRYASAHELADELGRYLRGEPIQARPLPAVARLGRWAKRNPLVAGLSAMAALLLIAGSAISSYFAVAESHRADEAQTNLQEAQRQTKRANDKTEEAARNLALAETQRDRAERLAFSSQLALSQREWEVGDVAHARQVLAATQANLRGWEYDYLHAQFSGGQREFVGHGGPVYCTALSPDGKRLVSGAYRLPATGEVRIWDVATGKLLHAHDDQEGTITGVAYVAEGRLIVTGGMDRIVRVRDGETGKLIRSMPGHATAINCLAASDKCRRVATGGGLSIVGGERAKGEVKLWDWETGQETVPLAGHEAPVLGVAFNRAGDRLASVANNGQIKIWDVASGKELHSWQAGGGACVDLDFTPDGQQLIGGCTGPLGEIVKIWHVATGKLVREWKAHARTINRVELSPDGRLLASGAGSPHGQAGEIKLWEFATGKELRSLKGSANSVAALAFSDDGRRIVSGGGKHGQPGELRLWEVEPPRDELTSPYAATCLGVLQQGQRIAGGLHDGQVKVWDAATREEVLAFAAHPGGVVAVFAGANDAELVSVGRKQPPAKVPDYSKKANVLQVKRWNLANRQELSAFECENFLAHHSRADKLAVAEGEYGKPGTLFIVETNTGHELQRLAGHAGSLTAASFDPKSDRIASGGSDGALKLWNLATRQEVFSVAAHKNSINALSFTADGCWIISGGFDKVIRVWDSASGKLVREQTGHTTAITDLACLDDGSRIVSCGHFNLDPGEIKIWDLPTGQETLTLEYPASRVSLAPDGSYLLTIGAVRPNQGIIKVWKSSATND